MPLPHYRTDLPNARRFLKKYSKRVMPSRATEASVFVILCCIAFFVGTIYFAAIKRSYQGVTTTSHSIVGRTGFGIKYHSPLLNVISEPRGIVMSCPFGPSHNHHGSWKPAMMIDGVAAVAYQLQRFNSSLPLLLGYYNSETSLAKKWCNEIVEKTSGTVRVICFKIPERYPVGLYGYAKIFAIAHAPAEHILWLDCDMYPVRPLEPLFDDEEYMKSGAMFWADSRDHFDEMKLKSILPDEKPPDLFPLNAWWVRQGFDSGMLLMRKSKCIDQINDLCHIAREKSQKALRALSMGDKDLFHIVWMLHNKNFTLVPWIGESGHLQMGKLQSTGRRRGRRRRRFKPKRDHTSSWTMSSQLKFGRNGEVYVLHQLHHYATGGRVKPVNIAKVDLRTSGSQDIRSVVESRAIVPEFSPKWIHDAAKDMERAWGEDRSRIGAIAKTIYETHATRIRKEREARLKRYATRERYDKRVYSRLWGKSVLRTFDSRNNQSSAYVKEQQKVVFLRL